MDRTNLTIVPALRLLLVGGLFAMFWIIFGAGSAHAAPAPPPGESPNTATGLVPSLNAAVKPLTTVVQPGTEPVPASSPTPASVPVTPPTAQPLGVTAPASIPGRQTAAPPTGAPTNAQGPTTALQDLTNPINGFTGAPAAPLTPPVAPLTAPVTELVSGTVQPLVAPLTAPVTELVSSTVEPLTAPVTELVSSTVETLTAPVTELVSVSGTVEPLVVPLTTLAGSALNPIVNPVEGITLPLPGLISGSPAPTAASPVAPVTADTFPGGGDHATQLVETRRAAVFTAKSSASTTALTRQFVAVTAGSAPRAAASMNDGASPQSPARLPGEYVPATTPAPSPLSGSAGGAGPTGAGAQTAADLSHHFVLPMTGGGEGSLFSFVLPGPTTQDPGFSPD